MKLIDSYLEHLQRISECTLTDLDMEVQRYMSQDENKGLSEDELFDKVYAKYGIRIKAVENMAQCKLMKKINGWLVFFGILFIVTLILFVIWFLYALIK